MLTLIVGVLLKAAVVFGVAKVVPGITVKDYGTPVGVALVYGVLNAALMWLLVLLTLPLVIVTFGLFALVLNGLLLWVTDKLFENFEIKGLPALAMATVGITVGGVIVDAILKRA